MSGTIWQFRAVTPENFKDVGALFEGRGGPRHSWCMVWRKDLHGKPGKAGADDRRTAMVGLVAASMPVGLLGYDQGIPVAWCSPAPRALFAPSLSSYDASPGLWSLTCFFIRADHRKQTDFAAILAAAEAHAARNGATEIEAYPVAPDSPSYRFCGFVPSFERAGYVEIGQAGTRRHVVRKAFGRAVS